MSESQIDHILTNNRELVSFLNHLCKKDDPLNLSSHDALVGKIKISKFKEKDDVDYTDTYEAFQPTKIIWNQNQEYQEMTANILGQLLSNYDQPEHLPALAEMSSKMIAMCAQKCFEVKQFKKSQKKQTPKFSKELQDAYQIHRKMCNKWRKAGRPEESDHQAKKAKLASQRNIQKIAREEEANKAKANHDDLMETHNKNISDVCKKVKKICGEQMRNTEISEVETFLGCYTGENVLEGFRSNTECLCNEKDDKNFSDDFLNRCIEDIRIINELSDEEELKIPPITLEKLQHIVHKKLKNNKACDIYHLTPEHLKHAGDDAAS